MVIEANASNQKHLVKRHEKLDFLVFHFLGDLFACENKDSVDRVIFSPDQKWARDEALELA